MKTNGQLILQAFTMALILSGCSFTREPVQSRDEFFRPVLAAPQQNNSLSSSVDVGNLKNQLELATRAVILLRDSLNSLQQFTGSLLASTRTLVDKINELEKSEFLATNKQRELEQNVAVLQSENKEFSKQLMELRTRLLTGNMKSDPSIYSQARSITSFSDEYSEGVSLFKRRKYEDALTKFSSLLDRGIEERLADHCEYWIGECHFAQKDYNHAIIFFQKVLTLDSSNKKIDAYFMLGKSYEQIDDLVKARWAYEELSLLYPKNVHARFVKSRLDVIKRTLPLPLESKHKKTNT
ncbi:MAG: tetratricopeptide repeat protein [Bacteroidota bacterium]|jgi:TolA-binding protein